MHVRGGIGLMVVGWVSWYLTKVSVDMFIFLCMVLDSTYLYKLVLNLNSASNKC